MFRFKPTTQTYSDPVSATFKPGIPFGREYSKGDMCLLHDGFQSSKIFLNSTVLREAILNSKEYLEEALGLKITDKDEVPKPKGKPEPREVSDADILGGSIDDVDIDDDKILGDIVPPVEEEPPKEEDKPKDDEQSSEGEVPKKTTKKK